MSAHRHEKGLEGRGLPNVDAELRHKHQNWLACPKGHLNSPNALVCWKCGRPIEEKNTNV